jgi:hypothetical protein
MQGNEVLIADVQLLYVDLRGDIRLFLSERLRVKAPFRTIQRETAISLEKNLPPIDSTP